MDQNFITWLNATLTPGRFDILSASMESIYAFNGEPFTQWQSTLMAELGYHDTAGLHQIVESNLLRFQVETLSRFGVVIDTEVAGTEHVHLLDGLIRGLLNADQYQIPHAILSCLAGDLTANETLAEIVAEVLGTVADDYIPLIHSVSPDLLLKIKQLMEQLLEQQVDDLVVPSVTVENTELRNRVFAFVNGWGSSNPIIEYVEGEGRLGLPAEYYVKLFHVWLGSVALDFEKESAKAWCCIAMMSEWWELSTPELLQAIEPWLPQVYGNVLRTMKVRNALIKLLGELR